MGQPPRFELPLPLAHWSDRIAFSCRPIVHWGRRFVYWSGGIGFSHRRLVYSVRLFVYPTSRADLRSGTMSPPRRPEITLTIRVDLKGERVEVSGEEVIN